MKLTTVLLSFLVAGAAVAQNSTPSLKCDDNGSNWGRNARHCEMREQTIAYAGQLNIDGKDNGGISVKGWDRSDVLVRMKIETGAATEGEAAALATQVRVSTGAGRIVADGPVQAEGRNWAVSYEVFTPRNSNVELNTRNGGVHIADVRGNIKFSAVNGGIHLARVNGRVTGETRNGGVHVELAGSRWDGEGLDIKTVNGGVHVSLPANYSAQLEASTVNGGVKNAFAPASAERHQTEMKTSIGAGGAPLKIVTTNGGVTIARI